MVYVIFACQRTCVQSTLAEAARVSVTIMLLNNYTSDSRTKFNWVTSCITFKDRIDKGIVVYRYIIL